MSLQPLRYNVFQPIIYEKLRTSHAKISSPMLTQSAVSPTLLSQALRPLRRFPLIDTNSPDEFWQMLARRFGALAFQINPEAGQFEAQRCYVRFKDSDIIYGACSAAYQVRFPRVPMVKQHFALSGAARTAFDGRQFNISRHEAVVVPPGVEMIHAFDAGFQSLIFRAEAPALQAKLSAALGMPVTRNIEFILRPSFANPAVERLRRTLEFLVSELDRDEGTVSPAAFVEFEQLLLLTFLTANQHNYSHLLEREQPRPGPWQVRRVEEYVAANWNRPITVEALASAAGASARSVFKAFKDARACSPMAFVKSVRLQHARQMLQHPESTTTVVSTAFACGFLNPGHFARDYRRAFGELPSATLAASKHQRH
jgi:AraC-like DNA-binding protein